MAFNLRLAKATTMSNRAANFQLPRPFHATEVHLNGGLPFLSPFLRQGEQDKQVQPAPVCHPWRGFVGVFRQFSHRFPFTPFRASAVGYVVTSLRDSQ